MKIEGIEVTNWLTHRHLALALSPMTIIAGGNHSGKSSIADAVPFALTGEIRRSGGLTGPSARKRLLSEGASKGVVSLAFSKDSLLTRDITTGKLTQSAAFPAEGACFDALDYLTDISLFARTEPDARRDMLHAVLGVDLSQQAIGDRLEERGVRADVMKELRAAHTGGLANWVEMARNEAAAARAAWKRHTGETYGSVKAASWVAPVPARPSEQAVADAQTAYDDALAAVVQAERAIGGATVRAETRKQQSATIARLKDQVAGLTALKAETATVIQREEEAHDRHATARDNLTAMKLRSRGEVPCPHCGCLVMVDAQGHMNQSSGVTAIPRPWQVESAQEQVDQLAGELAAASNRRREHEAKITQIGVLQSTLADLEREAASAPPVDASAEEAAAAAIEKRSLAWQAREELARQVQAADEAVNRTTRATAAHQLVEQWVKVGELISPDGIPGELLLEKMKPMADGLREVASATGWQQVSIGADMTIMADGRVYDLLSESERWRADVSLGVVMAKLSKLKLVIIDRFDVLEVAARGPAMQWLYRLVKAGAVETLLLMGTMKEPPKAPAAVRVHWLGSGHAAQAAAA